MNYIKEIIHNYYPEWETFDWKPVILNDSISDYIVGTNGVIISLNKKHKIRLNLS